MSDPCSEWTFVHMQEGSADAMEAPAAANLVVVHRGSLPEREGETNSVITELLRASQDDDAKKASDAMLSLGMCFEEGYGVEANATIAFRFALSNCLSDTIFV